jgi:hypothetical protein
MVEVFFDVGHLKGLIGQLWPRLFIRLRVQEDVDAHGREGYGRDGNGSHDEELQSGQPRNIVPHLD